MQSGSVTLTLWTSNFCGGCTATRHVVARAKNILGDRIHVVERNVADKPGDAAANGITETPTIVVTRGDTEITRASGTPALDQLFVTVAHALDH